VTDQKMLQCPLTRTRPIAKATMDGTPSRAVDFCDNIDFNA
jgi:hypothetical protein